MFPLQGGAPAEKLYVEDVFSTYLYTGNGSTQTITNGIDLAGKGGLVWAKDRTFGNSHNLFDTVRGANKRLISSATSAEQTQTDALTAFNSSGFSLGADSQGNINAVGSSYASWTFRKQPKFFDVVTYTGDGATSRNIAHSLGSKPGCVIVKRTDSSGDWVVTHAGSGTLYPLRLNSTDAQGTTNMAGGYIDIPNNSTFFTVATFGANTLANVNANGGTYVAYLFAHNAGGFGLSGTDNVISCGSYTGNGAEFGSLVNLGYEPQWLLVKNASSSTESWFIVDNMRGLSVELGTEDAGDLILFPNLSNAEINRGRVRPEATGFTPRNFWNVNGNTFIYIAIRRGPMKTPTTGTQVFMPMTWTGTGTNNRVLTGVGFPTDLAIFANPARNTYSSNYFLDRLRAPYNGLRTDATAAEGNVDGTTTASFAQFGNTSVTLGSASASAFNYNNRVFWSAFMGRAPGFFDQVCFTTTQTPGEVYKHNLGVVPELMIQKARINGTLNWYVATSSIGLYLNTTDGNTGFPFDTGLTTATQFAPINNASNVQWVTYLFASCPGVSKIGTYTGTGSTQIISCGFAARFVIIKRTDGTGTWWVWDTARGMVAGTDPRLALNSTAAETNANWVYTNASGFQIVTTDATVNANGGSYIYLAIA